MNHSCDNLAPVQQEPDTPGHYPAELRRRTCERMLAGEAVKDLVAGLGISEHTLYRWRRQASSTPASGQGPPITRSSTTARPTARFATCCWPTRSPTSTPAPAAPTGCCASAPPGDRTRTHRQQEAGVEDHAPARPQGPAGAAQGSEEVHAELLGARPSFRLTGTGSRRASAAHGYLINRFPGPSPQSASFASSSNRSASSTDMASAARNLAAQGSARGTL